MHYVHAIIKLSILSAKVLKLFFPDKGKKKKKSICKPNSYKLLQQLLSILEELLYLSLSEI